MMLLLQSNSTILEKKKTCLALIVVEILFLFSLKRKRLERKAGIAFPEKETTFTLQKKNLILKMTLNIGFSLNFHSPLVSFQTKVVRTLNI